MKKMNLPNKITIFRIILSFIIIIILLFPWYYINIEFPKYIINEKIVIDLKYVIAGFLFILASISDFIDGIIARKYKLITSFGKTMDSIADKILTDPLLIILAANGMISPVIPVVIIIRDSIVNAIKMIVGTKEGAIGAILSGKIKAACLMFGLALTLFYNLPFELWNLDVATFLLVVGTILSVVSGIEYYVKYKKHLFIEN